MADIKISFRVVEKIPELTSPTGFCVGVELAINGAVVVRVKAADAVVGVDACVKAFADRMRKYGMDSLAAHARAEAEKQALSESTPAGCA